MRRTGNHICVMAKKENSDVRESAQKAAERTAEQQAERKTLPHRTAVIVGASSGIGRETALQLASRGYRVVNVSRTPCKGDRIQSIAADAAQEGELARAIHAAVDENGMDLFIYSAGFSMAAPVENAKSGDYRYLFEVNYFGAVEALKAALPHLKKRGGRAILVGSVGGDIPIPYDGFYSSSKAALTMLAREADMELKRFGVRVSALLPGGTATDFTYSRRIYGSEDSPDYAGNVKKASAALANMEQGGMNVSLVAAAVLRLAQKKNPPPVCVVGGKNGALRFFNRLLPERLVDYMVLKKFNQK